ncbi:MAG: hypothetical protein ACOVP4_15080 [Bacteriovoracaceae bacterium]
MNQLIIFTKDESLKSFLENEIKNLTDTIPVITDSSEYFITITSMFDDLEAVIICEVDLEIINALNSRETQVKKILEINKTNSSKPQSIKCDHYLQLSHQKIEDFKNTFSTFFMKTNDLVNEVNKETELLSVPLMSLTHFKFAPCAFYIKNSLKNKILSKDEEINREKVLDFLNKNYEEVYFLKSENKDFTALLINGMINKVEKDYSNIEEKLQSNNEVYHTTRELASKLGFPAKVIQVVTAIIEKIAEDAIKENTLLRDYILRLRSNDDLGFRFRFAELSSIIAVRIVQNIPAAGQDPVNKVVFACLFCDMTLKDRSHIHVRNTEDLAKLPVEIQKEISKHAFDASEIAAKSKNVPFESDKLIRQHHGAYNGVGFPSKIAPQISPLALAIFAAQEIAYEALIDGKKNINQICSLLTQRHTNTTLINYFKVFEESITKDDSSNI